MEAEIKEEFTKSGFSFDVEVEILKKCLTICINYKLSPRDLVINWDAYSINRDLKESVVQNGQMDGFLLYIQSELKEAIVREESHLHVYSSNDVDEILSYEHGDTKESFVGTPSDKHGNHHSELIGLLGHRDGDFSSSGMLPEHVTPFGQRRNKFVVQSTNNDLTSTKNLKKEGKNDDRDYEILEDDIIRKVPPNLPCSFEVIGSGPEPGCRFMYDRIEDKFDYLENRIRRHATAFVASALYDEPVDPTVISQRTGFSVGMICCDGEGHLNDKSILLQSSIEHSGGQCVHLDLQKLSHFSIFPGQVVGVEGNNPSGHHLVVSKIIDSIPLSASADENLHRAKRQALDQDNSSAPLSHKFKELSLIIAAGPYTTTDNLYFEPLSELLAYARRKQPQLLVLLGPFVDSEHPEVKKGTIDRTYVEIFHLEIIRRLQDYVEYMGSAARVVLVPSIRDANHDFVFPQPAFDIHLPEFRDQITSLTNPGFFNANQVKVGCCSVDILKQLAGEVLSRKPTDGSSWDGRSRLANHILSQRSFYPLYPQAEGVPLDFSLAPEALHISSIVDILILPSDLAQFVKVLSLGGSNEGEERFKCICLNPGRLAKGESGGYFVELNYNGSPDSSNASIISI